MVNGFSYQGGFAESGRGRDEGKLACYPLIELCDETRAQNIARPKRWHIQFRLQQVIEHRNR